MINKPFKIKTENFDNILFTSDQHYGHDPKWIIPLWKIRGFNSVNEHDVWLENEYSKITNNSLIISLGDPALNNTPEKLLYLFNKTSAPILHIWGNHFSCDYYLYKLGVKKYIFDKVTNYPDEKLDMSVSLDYEIYPFNIERKFIDNKCDIPLKKDIKLINGFPGFHIKPDHITFLGSQCDILIDNTLIHLSHMAPRLWTRHSIAIFGHSHGELKDSQPKDTNQKILDCGIENSIKYNGSAFFSFNEILNIMSKKTSNTEDNH